MGTDYQEKEHIFVDKLVSFLGKGDLFEVKWSLSDEHCVFPKEIGLFRENLWLNESRKDNNLLEIN